MGGWAETLEIVWLVSLAVIVVWPLAVLLLPSELLNPPIAIHFPGDEVAELASLPLIIAGSLLLGWSFRSLGRFTTIHLQLTADHTIVQEGPYARVCHPMYTADMVLGVGVA